MKKSIEELQKEFAANNTKLARLKKECKHQELLIKRADLKLALECTESDLMKTGLSIPTPKIISINPLPERLTFEKLELFERYIGQDIFAEDLDQREKYRAKFEKSKCIENRRKLNLPSKKVDDRTQINALIIRLNELIEVAKYDSTNGSASGFNLFANTPSQIRVSREEIGSIVASLIEAGESDKLAKALRSLECFHAENKDLLFLTKYKSFIRDSDSIPASATDFKDYYNSTSVHTLTDEANVRKVARNLGLSFSSQL